MDQEYLSVKLTVSPLGNKRYRSRIEEAHGSNSGAGYEFRLDQTKGSKDAPSVVEFTKSISNGTVASLEQVQNFGRWLFQRLFKEDVATKYGELRGKAGSRKLRICISVHDPALINIPWEYLHDGSNFLIHHGYSIVRVLDELTGDKSSYAPIRSILLAAADPHSPDYDSFRAQEHIDAVQGILAQRPGTQVTPLVHASKAELLEALRSNCYDAVYFVGHGETAKSTSRLICEDKNGAPEGLDASEAAQFLRRATRCRFVYLNSCSTAKTSAQNPFQGVAQRFMLDGEVAAVAAMQVDVRQGAGLDMATAFFRELKDHSPEEAMHTARTQGNSFYSFGVPALYSYVNAPDAFETNRLKSFLSADENSTYSLLMASFYLGYAAEKGQPPLKKHPNVAYPGETFAMEDTRAAWSVLGLLTSLTMPENITICSSTDKPKPDDTHYFVFGSRSNPVMESIRKGYADKFKERFKFEYVDKGWYIHDTKTGHPYAVEPPPKHLTVQQYKNVDDYGIIQKVIVSKELVYFILAGLGSRATQGCGWYLAQHWRDHLDEEQFTILLKFPGGLDFSHARLIDLETGKPAA